jgi:hypothetical protein
METERLQSRPALRFFGGLVMMLLASVLAAFVVGNALQMWNPNWGGQNLVAALCGAAAGPFIGLAGLAWFAIRRRDWMLFLGGLTVFVVWFPLIVLFLQLGPFFGGGL